MVEEVTAPNYSFLMYAELHILQTCPERRSHEQPALLIFVKMGWISKDEGMIMWGNWGHIKI